MNPLIDNKLAPVVLFVYNRPDTTAQTLRALRANDQAAASRLFIFADGPKLGADLATWDWPQASSLASPTSSGATTG